ncbi:hypothetical protein [Nocardiopsis sp. LOL_012]|uniref:hypothetical protein n=1 Tax=Nocardiopsis sp. LOL_012 TaxID=3345409 RepID=UPI003A8435D3
MEDTWFSRDLPVLKAVVKLADVTPFVDAAQVDEETGMDPDQVDRALRALKDGGFFTRADGTFDRMIDTIYGVTGVARRTVGMWPTSQTMAESIVAEIEEQAETEPDETKRGWFKKTAGAVGGAGRDLSINLLAAVIAKQTGL